MNVTPCWDETGIKLDIHKVPRSPHPTFHMYRVTCVQSYLPRVLSSKFRKMENDLGRNRAKVIIRDSREPDDTK